MNELPQGWTVTSLINLLLTLRDGTHTPPKRTTLGVPLLSARNVQNGHIEWNEAYSYISPEDYQGIQRTNPVSEGDVLLSIVGSIGRSCVNRTANRFTLQRSVAIAKPDSRLIDSDHLSFLFRAPQFQAALENLASGTAQRGVYLGALKKILLPLAPLNEQRRIVAKLEKFMGRVNAAQERLATIPRILRRFRQSVLAAASCGNLTADWREQNPNAQSALELMGLITKTRELKKSLETIEAGESPDEVPTKWVWIRFGSVIKELRNGISIRPNIEEPGTPILRINAARSGRIDLNEVRFLKNGGDYLPEYGLKDGDLLFTRYNGSLELLGVCGMVRGLGNSIRLYPDKLMRVRFDHRFVLPEYAEIFFQAPDVHERVIAKSKSSAGQNGVSGSDIKAQAFALVPFEEQEEIVRRVDALFKTADALEARYLKAKSHVDKLTQSILAKAFRGELVPQDPNDEPASVLLKRNTGEPNGSAVVKRRSRK